MDVKLNYLKKDKAERMAKIYQKGIRLNNDCLKVEKYDEAIILPAKKHDDNKFFNRQFGGVIDKNGKYVETSASANPALGGGYEIKTWKQVEKIAVYCGIFWYSWGHFLVDIIPRLWYALEADEKIDEYIIICTDFDLLQGNIFEFFDLLGIADKVRILTEPIKYKKVIVPQLSYMPNRYYSPKYIQTFDYVIENALAAYEGEKTTGKKIFLTRSGLTAAAKRDCGIEMIDSFFKNNDYDILYPERIPLKQWIYIINHCTDFACIKGSSQHNLLFAKKIINTVIIERNFHINGIQNYITMMRNLNVTFIDVDLSVLPINSHSGPFVYAYNACLKRYIQDMGLRPPDYQYTTKEYRNKTIMKYFEGYSIQRPFEKKLAEEYILTAYNENIQELYPDFQFLQYQGLSEFLDENIIRRRAIKYFMDYNVPRQGWDAIDTYPKIIKTIERMLNNDKKEFLIYPFGKNGILFKHILNECYGIKEKMIFDNKLCHYNKNMKPIKDIQRYYNDKSCLILTSNKIECRNDLLKYCKLDMVESLFML